MKTDLKILMAIGLFGIGLILTSNVADKGNMAKGKESYDVTYIEYIDVSSASYIDQKPDGIYNWTAGFKVFNPSTDTVGIVCQPLMNNDTIRLILSHGWCPVVIKAVFADTTNGITSIMTGR